MASEQAATAENPTAQLADPTTNNSSQNELADLISKHSFDEWFDDKTHHENILEGKPYFNLPQKPREPTYHTPSKLLRCHRQTYYDRLAAPEEEPAPRGIFWWGSQIEEELILPYLSQVAEETGLYVTNSIWIHIHRETPESTLEIKGSTDPVIVDDLGVPVLPTEVKSRKNVMNTTSPSERHLAQIHAYMEGLSEKYDKEIREGVLLYIGRESLNLKSFHIDFDPEFWEERVLDWARKQSAYRKADELPADSPEKSWECDYCSYRERCGKGDREYADTPPEGFLPLFEYPRAKADEYLRGNANAKLTPTLAHLYPQLAESHPIHDWTCPGCSSTFDWLQIQWEADIQAPPNCPNCANKGMLRCLKPPSFNGGFTHNRSPKEPTRTNEGGS